MITTSHWRRVSSPAFSAASFGPCWPVTPCACHRPILAAALLRSPAPAPALVLGVPLGTLLGRAIGWQGAFGLMTLMAVMLVVWIIAIVPDFPAG